MPITPPHPPKRPRTSRMVRRSRSLGSQDRERTDSTLNRGPSSFGFSRESTMESQLSRRVINSAGEMQARPKERIEVMFNTKCLSTITSGDKYYEKCPCFKTLLPLTEALLV